MSTESTFVTTPSKAKPLIERCIKAGLVPFLQSSPGIGKSSIVKKIAEDYNLELIDLRLSMCTPEDLNGLPRFHEGKVEFIPFSLFPLKDTPLPEGKDGWLLFLDEFNSASKNVQAAAYKLVLDRHIGMYPLHKNVAVVAAGNHTSDGAITTQMSTAMQSRLVHLKMGASLQDWLQEVAYPEKYDERIVAYLQYSPDSLMRFDPQTQMVSGHAFSCPRTWEFANRLIQGEQDLESLIPLLMGVVSEQDVLTFIRFCQVYRELPNIKDILKEPKKVVVPNDSATQWAVLVHVVNYATEENLDVLTKYIKRFPKAMWYVFAKQLGFKDQNFLLTKEYINIAHELGELMHE